MPNSTPAQHVIEFEDRFQVSDPKALGLLRLSLMEQYGADSIVTAVSRDLETRMLAFLVLERQELVITYLKDAHEFRRSFKVCDGEITRLALQADRILRKVWCRYIDQARQETWRCVLNENPTTYGFIAQRMTPTTGSRLAEELKMLAEIAGEDSSDDRFAQALYLTANRSPWRLTLTVEQIETLHLLIPSFKPLYNELVSPNADTQNNVCAFLKTLDAFANVIEGEMGLCDIYLANLELFQPASPA